MGLFYQRGTASGAKAQNVEWFASDLTPDTSFANAKSATWRVSLNIATSVVVQYTLDSGANWYSFSDTNPTAGIETTFVIHSADTDQFNMRTNDRLLHWLGWLRLNLLLPRYRLYFLIRLMWIRLNSFQEYYQTPI